MSLLATIVERLSNQRIAEVESRLSELPDDCRRLWQRLLED